MVFVERFLSEYFGLQDIELEFRKYWGSKGVEILSKRRNINAKYYILIFDAGGDGSVASAIRERARNMIEDSGYQHIIALRDLFRNDRSEKRDVVNAFYGLFSDYLFKDRLRLVLSIMEIEAWFLADYNLFSRIDPILTVSVINKRLGIDLEHDNSELYDHPAVIISQIYGLIGRTYKKRQADAYRIVYSIDYNYLCINEDVLNKMGSWKYFLDTVNDCFTESN